MKTTSLEYTTLKNLLPLTETEFRRFYRIWEEAQVLDVDSRWIEADGLFLAQKGLVTDGHRFIPEVLSKGARVLSDPSFPRQSPSWEKKIVRIPDLPNLGGKLGALFYHRPSEKLRIVGITGTDGKTSTTRMVAEAYQGWGHLTAGIGTLGTYIVGHSDIRIPHQDVPNTTPNPIILQRILYALKKQGVDTVVMEVSSHGLTLERVQEVAFDSGVWINLSPEHLDYHGSLENYARTKSRLFELLSYSSKKIKHGVMGLDSFIDLSDKAPLPWIQEIMGRIEPQSQNYPLSFFCHQSKKSAIEKILSPKLASQVTTYTNHPGQKNQEVIIKTGKNLGGRKRVLTTQLIGQFNAQNLTCAFLEAEHFRREQSLRLPWAPVKKNWKEIKIRGRLESFPLDTYCHPQHPRWNILKECHLYIDYAHTPQALEKVLNSLIAFRSLKEAPIPSRKVERYRGSRIKGISNPILCVFGCGGDRDSIKRKPMGAVACRLAEITIITDDNPRTEDRKKIRQVITAGWQEQYRQLPQKKKSSRSLEVIPGRREAICRALEVVPPGGIILLAGKGHEDYQIIGRTKYPFDEREVLREILSLK